MNDAQKAFEQWIEITGLKVGDKVMLVGDPDPWRIERGLDRLTSTTVQKGGIAEVAGFPPDCISVVSGGDGLGRLYFPFYVLLKINE
jgi:hypothetical protein